MKTVNCCGLEALLCTCKLLRLIRNLLVCLNSQEADVHLEKSSWGKSSVCKLWCWLQKNWWQVSLSDDVSEICLWTHTYLRTNNRLVAGITREWQRDRCFTDMSAKRSHITFTMAITCYVYGQNLIFWGVLIPIWSFPNPSKFGHNQKLKLKKSKVSHNPVFCRNIYFPNVFLQLRCK